MVNSVHNLVKSQNMSFKPALSRLRFDLLYSFQFLKCGVSKDSDLQNRPEGPDHEEGIICVRETGLSQGLLLFNQHQIQRLLCEGDKRTRDRTV